MSEIILSRNESQTSEELEKHDFVVMSPWFFSCRGKYDRSDVPTFSEECVKAMAVVCNSLLEAGVGVIVEFDDCNRITAMIGNSI